MKVKEIIQLIQDDGWIFDRQKGSHIIYKHPGKDGIVVVPNHGLSKDVKVGTANSILKQAGIK
jgi:predicted RNA binding protein YcfA (HicA-like mRNA interferase family)